MFEICTIGIDLAKNVIQVHCVDINGEVVVRRQLQRSQFLAFFEGRPSCLVGIEACSGAHHWGRRLREMGALPDSMGAAFLPPEDGKDAYPNARASMEVWVPACLTVQPAE